MLLLECAGHGELRAIGGFRSLSDYTQPVLHAIDTGAYLCPDKRV